MPVVLADTGFAAFERLCENLNSPTFERSVGADNEDINFLSQLMNNVIVQELVEAHDVLGAKTKDPVSCDNIITLKQLSNDLAVPALKNDTVKELVAILNSPHFKSLIEAHDDVAAKNYEVVIPDDAGGTVSLNDISMIGPNGGQAININQTTTDAIRMVGIRKNPDEALGITVRSEEAGLVIARIMAGSMIERQGLLHVNDIIKEVNGTEVTSPEQLMDVMKKSNGNITLKILPTTRDQNAITQIFLKAHFTFDPKRDNLIPSREAGLAFKDGDILQVVNQEDPHWWQASKVDATGLSGLIPSQQLEEKRKAFVRPEFDYTHKSLLCGIMTKKKRKVMYQTRMNAEFERTDLLIYEEVTRMPPFQRKTLVLIGAKGVGRRTLKQRLIAADPQRFGSVLPHTSRPMEPGDKNGEAYWYVPEDEMIRDIAENKFIEYGEYDGAFYGTKFETIRQCFRSGRMCILDISPQAAKAIKTPEFMPFIVFVGAAPVEIMRNMHEFARQRGKTDKYITEQEFRATLDESKRIERQYKQYFDLTIVNDNMDETYNKLRKAIESLSTEAQWVPVTWVY